MSWTQELLEELMELWKNQPSLYDSDHKDYINRIKRESALKLITMQLKTKMPTIGIEDIRKKMHCLRTQYANEHRMIKRSLQTSTDEIYEPRLWYFENLSFLENHLHVRTTESNIADDMDYDTFAEFVDVNASLKEDGPMTSATGASSYHNLKKRKLEIHTVNLQKKLESLKEYVANKKNEKYDWLGQEVIYYMQKIKDPILQEETSCEIQLALKEFINKDRILREEAERKQDKLTKLEIENKQDYKEFSEEESLDYLFLETDCSE